MTPTYLILIRLLCSVVVFLIGLVLTLLDSRALIQHVGLAFMVAGLVSTFHEVVLRRLEGDEAAGLIAERVRLVLRDTPLQESGIRLVADRRTDFHEYLTWATHPAEQKLFFAGRSVLHRLDGELRKRRLQPADRVIARRVLEGADIRILLLDPRSELVPGLAHEEGQSAEQLLRDIDTSLEICGKIHHALDGKQIPAKAHLEIKVFDQVPYFAYHQVDDKVIIGFYFASSLGHSSPAYEVIDARTKEYFGAHFLTLFAAPATSTVLRIDPHRRVSELEADLLGELRKAIAERRGHARA